MLATIAALFIAMFALPQQAAAEDYSLWIAGTQVTSKNCNDLSVISGVSGTVKFDPKAKTLTLDNAVIHAKEMNIGIVGNIDGLTIGVNGTVDITAKAMGVNLTSSTSIKGNGTLYVKSLIAEGIFFKDTELTINGCTVNVKGKSGIAARHADSPFPEPSSNKNCLTIRKATVTVEGNGQEGSICRLKALTLEGCAITSPVGAAFNASLMGVALNGSLVKEKVEISRSTAYVVKDGTTLTFYYDANKGKRTGTTYSINDKRTDDNRFAAWAGSYVNRDETVTKVAFDASFRDYKPTTTLGWFPFLTALTNMTGMENLNTDNVTDMSFMFAGCSALTSLDVSKFNTANVIDMSNMFNNCSTLVSLDVSKFNTAKVTNMSGMFSNCKALTSLDVSKFNTANVTDMNLMFNGCKSLTTLDVSHFNTAKVTNMNYMFSECSALTTIYCNNIWKCDLSKDMFRVCMNLKGAVTFDENKTDVSMANPTTGYFTKKVDEAYVVKDGNTLTFYYNDDKTTSTGTRYGINDLLEDDADIPAWAGDDGNENDRITKVIFDSSFKNYKATTTNYWFYYCTKLKTIEGIENLSTDQVTSMFSMFANCSALTSLDLSSFNTANVTNMCYMFRDCSALTSVDVSKFNTANVIWMFNMFVNCSALISVDVSNFNTANVTDMSDMFRGCSALTSLDVSNFNTAKANLMERMFSGCSALTTIYCNDTWKCDKSENMFSDCTKLKGAVAYDATKVDVSMANPTTGYFTPKAPNAIAAVTTAVPATKQGTYNLAGQRVGDDYKGIVIENGRKVVKR